MKRAAYFILGATLAAAAAFAAPASAEDPDEPPSAEQPEGHLWLKHKEIRCKEMREHMAKVLKEKVGLSDEQVKKLEALHDAHEKTAKPLHEAAAKAMRKLHGEVEIEAQEADVAAALDAAKSAQKALFDEREKMMSQADALLNPTQRAKMFLMRQKMKRRRMMMARMHGGEYGSGWGRNGWPSGWDKGGDEEHRGGGRAGHDERVEDDDAE